MGVAVGDYNNDGFPDIFVTCVGQNRLFRNTGKGTFVDVTRPSGLGGRLGFSTSALWFDYNRDGLLDLFVCNYVKWSRRARRVLQRRRQAEVVLHAGGVPRRHVLAVPQPRRRHLRGRHGDERRLRHELEVARRDHARLRPATAGRTCSSPTTRSRTSCTATCATARSATSRSRRASPSTPTARRGPAWASTPATSTTRAAPGLAITNFENEMIGLYREVGPGRFEDVAMKAGRRPAVAAARSASAACSPTSIWTARSISSSPTATSTSRCASMRGNVGYAQPPQLFLNRGDGTFEDVAAARGRGVRQREGRARPGVRRLRSRRRRRHPHDHERRAGAALSQRLRSPADRSIRFKLRGTTSNRDAIGATVRIVQPAARCRRAS